MSKDRFCGGVRDIRDPMRLDAASNRMDDTGGRTGA